MEIDNCLWLFMNRQTIFSSFYSSKIKSCEQHLLFKLICSDNHSYRMYIISMVWKISEFDSWVVHSSAKDVKTWCLLLPWLGPDVREITRTDDLLVDMMCLGWTLILHYISRLKLANWLPHPLDQMHMDAHTDKHTCTRHTHTNTLDADRQTHALTLALTSQLGSNCNI